MTIIHRGARVEWRSMGDRRPFVFFKGTVLAVPTAGKWLGYALIDDGLGRSARHVSITRLKSSTSAPRSTSLGGAA